MDITAICCYCNSKLFSDWKLNELDNRIYNLCKKCDKWSEYDFDTDSQIELPEPNKTTGEWE